MKTSLIILTGLTAINVFAQSEGAKIAAAAQAEVERQRSLYAQKAYQDALQAQIQAAQQAELNLIYSKDPWRAINGSTNYIGGSGWYEFQGKSQEVMADGVVFKGKWGQVLTVYTDESSNGHLVKRVSNSGQASVTTYSSTTTARASGNAVEDTSIERQLIYGDDFFIVKNFPYPADARQGYEQMMAYLDGYYTYTNSSRQVLTIKSFDYGKPCVKTWSPEALAAAKQKSDQKKHSTEDKVLKSNQDSAGRGEPYGMMRMGERYRDGDGVEKDLTKARDYLTKAAAAGSQTAADELKQLPLNQL